MHQSKTKISLVLNLIDFYILVVFSVDCVLKAVSNK